MAEASCDGVVRRIERSASTASARGKCVVCLEGDDEPTPIQSGCACRGEAGLVHLECAKASAIHHGDFFHSRWYECFTCKQEFTGEVLLALARTLVQRLEDLGNGPEDQELLECKAHLAVSA